MVTACLTTLLPLHCLLVPHHYLAGVWTHTLILPATRFSRLLWRRRSYAAHTALLPLRTPTAPPHYAPGRVALPPFRNCGGGANRCNPPLPFFFPVLFCTFPPILTPDVPWFQPLCGGGLVFIIIPCLTVYMGPATAPLRVLAGFRLRWPIPDDFHTPTDVTFWFGARSFDVLIPLSTLD